MLTEQEAAELLNDLYLLSSRFEKDGWLETSKQITRMRSKVSWLLYNRDELREQIARKTVECNTAIFERDEAQKKVARLEEEWLAKKNPHRGDKLDREIADAREDLMQARTNETWGWSDRAQMATQFAAAMVGTIHNDTDYRRLRQLAKDCGLPSVSAWIAAEANKQAGALLDELNR